MIGASGCAGPDLRDDLARPARRRTASKSVLVEHAGPAIEDLHGIGAGLDLRDQIIGRDASASIVEQLREGLRIAIGKQPRRRLIGRAVPAIM